MKKVLIITYYWPPSGGSGVQRWLKFSKYLPEFGWQPIIFTPSNPEYPAMDEGLLKEIPKEAEIIKIPITEPYQFYRLFTGKSKENVSAGFLSEKKSNKTIEHVAKWVRGNFFIPDARKWWIKPASDYLMEYLKENRVDAIISTGPPHSMHLIAEKIVSKLGIPWIADFRDPWTKIDFYKELNLSSWADAKHHEMEKMVISKADRVITIGKTMADEFKVIANREVDVIYNGFDLQDVENKGVVVDEKFSIVHTGLMVPSRNPEGLWRALAKLVSENAAFKSKLVIRLIGKVDVSVKTSISNVGLDEFVEYVDYLPHHEVIVQQQKAKILLMIINNTPNAKGILTGKMFEYLASSRPILCIGPKDGEAGELLSEAGHLVIESENVEEIKQTLETLFNTAESEFNFNKKLIQKFDRKNCTEELVALLDYLKVT